MQQSWPSSGYDLNKNLIKRNAVAFLLSFFIVLVILLVPLSKPINLTSSTDEIKVELFKSTDSIRKIKSKPNDEIIKQIKEPSDSSITINNTQKGQKTSKKKSVDRFQDEKVSIINPSVQTHKAPNNRKKTSDKISFVPSSGDIYNLTYGKIKLYPVDKDFQVSDDNPNDFVFKKFERPPWMLERKLIDEEIDKPSVEMNFYALGIEGSVERFMDKITYKKRFVTKYGTKIDCAIVAVIVACGWK